MTKNIRTRYEQAAVSEYKTKLADAISASRSKLNAQLITGQAELNRIDSELSIRQSQLDLLKSGRTKLAGLIAECTAKIAAYDSIHAAVK